MAQSRRGRPYWSQVLRALREARGITQDGWALQLGYGRATVRRWESGESIPSADAEAKIIELCREKALFRRFTDAPLAGVQVTAEWLADLLAEARLEPIARSAVELRSPIRRVPEVRYAMSGDIAVAYQTFGSGPIDLVVTPGLVSHREVEWENEYFVRYFEKMAEFARVIVFDKRGTGMSDRVGGGTLEERMDDIRAVMDAAGSRKAALFGISEGGPISAVFAATYPERTHALVLYGSFIAQAGPEGFLDRSPVPLSDEQINRIRRIWGAVDMPFLPMYGPSVADDPEQQEWWARYLRIAASPGAAIKLMNMNIEINIRQVLPGIRVPTLVLHRRGDRAVNFNQSVLLAAAIPHSRFLELQGDDHLPMLGDVDALMDAVRQFALDPPVDFDADRVLATVLGAQIVRPDTESGDSDSDLQQQLVNSVRHELSLYRGRAIEIGDDRLIATFDGPTRALRCAWGIRDAARMLGLDARAGLHTGEVQVVGESISGKALQISRDIAHEARPGEVLASSTVTNLVAGSGFRFDERSLTCDVANLADLSLYRVLADD